MRKKPDTDDKLPSHPSLLCGPGTHRDNEASRLIRGRTLPMGRSFNPPPEEDSGSPSFRQLSVIAPGAIARARRR